ncbi:hypothetical protein [Mangrovicella endophytica]|uniref:hypothetical protein n=1 Tax=Mangrovicella endophytica TaxID=2066697 RepID=UPI000C9DEE9C|nr:hypothetical protein [Mangrovicella endophytica]
MSRTAAPLLMSAALLALSACQSAAPQRVATAPQPRGIEGAWSSVGGPVPYTATFSGGRFTSTESATGATLAAGTYTDRGPGQVNIIYTSTARNQRLAVNCNQVQMDRLSCASSNGSTFDLVRRG